MSDLAVGGLVAYWAVSRGTPQRWADRLGRAPIVLIYLAGIALVLCRNLMYTPTSSYVLQRFESLPTIFRRLIPSVFFAFIIVEQNWATNSPLKRSTFRLLTHLGKYTYGLCLLHPLALVATSFCLGVPAEGSVSLGMGVERGILGLALSLGLSAASYHRFELPFLRLKKRFTVVASGVA
jgi:peptidoglycan/LPS O-acetylase OafA/YrhL